MSESQEL